MRAEKVTQCRGWRPGVGGRQVRGPPPSSSLPPSLPLPPGIWHSREVEPPAMSREGVLSGRKSQAPVGQGGGVGVGMADTGEWVLHCCFCFCFPLK